MQDTTANTEPTAANRVHAYLSRHAQAFVDACEILIADDDEGRMVQMLVPSYIDNDELHAVMRALLANGLNRDTHANERSVFLTLSERGKFDRVIEIDAPDV